MRILVLSDIHGNLPALEAVLQQPLRFDAIWNLGDTVGYGPWPNKCVELVRSYEGSIHLAGNHDLAATGQISTANFNPIAAAAAHWTAKQLSPENREWLRGLSSLRIEEPVTLAHGSPRDPASEYVISPRQAAALFPYFTTRSCFVGHTHKPMIAMDGISLTVDALFAPEDGQVFDLSLTRSMLNPGSVGQPRDGNANAAFGTFDTESAQFRFHRVSYRTDLTKAAIDRAGLPRQLGDRLSAGL